MKEFALKHPIITLFIADIVTTGLYNTVKFIAAAFGKNQVIEVNSSRTKKEADTDEPAGDIQ